MAIKTTIQTAARQTTRTEYRKWRNILRGNGRAALGWMPSNVRRVFVELEGIAQAYDAIAERVMLLDLFRDAGVRNGVTYRYTLCPRLLLRLSQR